MAEIQKNNSELQQKKEKERAMRNKELRKSLLSSGTHFSFQTESRTKYTKLPSCFKARVCWINLLGASEVI